MFRCVECGCEYDTKPDFCDCGNDVFEEIIQKPEPEKPVQKEIHVNNKIPVTNRPAPRIVMTPPPKQPDPIDHPRVMADVVLLICIILSLGILFFIGNPKKEIAAEKPKQVEQTTVANIPSVDSFWDNTPPSVKLVMQQPAQQPTQVQPAKVSDPITIKFEQWLNSPQQPAVTTKQPQQKQISQIPVQKPITVKTVQPQQTRSIVTQNKPQIITQQKPKTQNTVNTSNTKTNSPGAPNDLLSRVQQSIKYTAPSTALTTPPKTNSTTAPTTKTHTTVTTPKTTIVNKQTQTAPTLRNATKQPVKSQAQLNQEVASYKASLRNNIGKKINFLNVVGDGNCAITFKVDSSGKLTNRNFSIQSSNITLNDAVYNAMMSTPAFNPPPEGYKNETMTLRVKIYDGNYEVTLN